MFNKARKWWILHTWRHIMTGFWRVKSSNSQSHNWCICWFFTCLNACDLPTTHHQNIREWCHSQRTCPLTAILTEQLQQFCDRPQVSLNCTENLPLCILTCKSVWLLQPLTTRDNGTEYLHINWLSCHKHPACFVMSLGIHSNSTELADTAQDLWEGVPCPSGTASRDWIRPRAPHT